jgi:hypothetical protein
MRRTTITCGGGDMLVELDGVRLDSRTAWQQLTEAIVGTQGDARRLEGDLPQALAERDTAALSQSRASRFPVSVLAPGLAARRDAQVATLESRLQSLATRRHACSLKVDVRLAQPCLEAFARLAAAHAAMARAERLWAVPAQQPDAALARQRMPAEAAPVLPEVLSATWPGLALRSREGMSFSVFPGFTLVSRRADEADLVVSDIREASVRMRELRIAEAGKAPGDAAFVGETWEKVNRDGTPDRRYASNARLAIFAYGLIETSAGSGDRMWWLVSDRRAALAFAEAFQAFQGALRNALAAAFEADIPPAGIDDADPVTVVPVVRIPPRPVARAPHEWTAGILVGVALGAFLAGGPPHEAQGLPTSALPGTVAPYVPLPTVPDQFPPQRTPSPSGPQAEPRREPPSAPSVIPAPAAPATMPPRPEAASQIEPSGQTATAEHVLTRTAANVRNGPSGTAPVVRTAPVGTRLVVFGRAPGGWVQVGDTAPWGWIHGSLLAPSE